MIISASRRTDIPAFYSTWFINRLREKYVLVRNPMNRKQVSKIPLLPELTDCIVFWTKNPLPLLEKLREIDDLGYTYYFQFTLTSYSSSIECNVPQKSLLIDIFRRLAERIGREKVIWRYDPILISDKISFDYHLKWFEYIAGRLEGYTDKCKISFLDLYKKCERNMKDIVLPAFDTSEKLSIAEKLFLIARAYNITVESCAEDRDLARGGVLPGKCIDETLISQLTGKRLIGNKDKGQRQDCGCVESIDIGSYNCCNHNCLYCYANENRGLVEKNVRLHDPAAPLIYGKLLGDENITRKNSRSLSDPQLDLFPKR